MVEFANVVIITDRYFIFIMVADVVFQNIQRRLAGGANRLTHEFKPQIAKS
jgi:hypothetical protein